MIVRGPNSTRSTPPQPAGLLGRKLGSCMERSCVRNHRSDIVAVALVIWFALGG